MSGPDLTLEEIIDMQPPPRGVRGWLRKNAAPIVMALIWAGGQLLGVGNWAWTRQQKERDLGEQVEQLRTDLQRAESIYVRQDVFGAVLKRIDDSLAEMNRKLDSTGRTR